MKIIFEFSGNISMSRYLPLCNIEKGVCVPTWQCDSGKSSTKKSKANKAVGRFGSQHLADRQSVLTRIK
ncbi:MAG: hypothetical protein JXB18_11925 [Sedimentisphaerales bacterium]|nr:hypothetical protein [Sedimentisphaerales bacterium]